MAQMRSGTALAPVSASRSTDHTAQKAVLASLAEAPRKRVTIKAGASRDTAAAFGQGFNASRQASSIASSIVAPAATKDPEVRAPRHPTGESSHGEPPVTAPRS